MKKKTWFFYLSFTSYYLLIELKYHVVYSSRVFEFFMTFVINICDTENNETILCYFLTIYK